MRKLTVGIIAGAALLVLSPLPSLAGEPSEVIVIIANHAVNATRVSRDELRPIFQTRRDAWSDGTPAKAFNLSESNIVRQEFDAAVLGLEPDRVARYWIDRKIRGGERPPPTAPSEAVMVKLIGKTIGGVGYVHATAVDGSVKVVAKIVGGQVVAP